VTIGYLDPSSGASGDMIIAAAVDAGADLDAIVRILDGLKLDGWALRADQVMRGGIAATSVVLLGGVGMVDADAVVALLLDRGAFDAWAVPLTGGRVEVRCLCPPRRIADLRAELSALDGFDLLWEQAADRWPL
jgi:hypothetical protein